MQNYTFRRKRMILTLAAAVVFFATAFFIVSGINSKNQIAFANTGGAGTVSDNFFFLSKSETVTDTGINVKAYIDYNATKAEVDESMSFRIFGPFKDSAGYQAARNYWTAGIINPQDKNGVLVLKNSSGELEGTQQADDYYLYGKAEGSYDKFLNNYSSYWKHNGWTTGDSGLPTLDVKNYTVKTGEGGYYFGVAVKKFCTVTVKGKDALGNTYDSYSVNNIVSVTSSNTLIKDPNEVANEWLTSDTEEKAKAAIKQLGYDTKYGKGVDDDTTCKIKYLKMDSEFTYHTVTDSKQVPFWRTFNEAYMKKYVLETWYDNAFSTFDAKYNKTVKALTDVGEIDGLVEERVLREATGFIYEHGKEATLTVEYTEFRPKDLYLRVLNNDPDLPNLKIDVYTADIVRKNGKCVIVFDCSRIVTQLMNRLNWITDISEGEIKITGKNENTVTAKEVVSTDDDGNRNIKVQVEVDEANVNDLFGLGLTYVARIVPNYKMSLVYDYLQIDEDLNESRKKTEPLLTDLITVIELGTLEGTKSYEGIYAQLVEAVSPSVLNGAEYCVLNKVSLFKTYPETEDGVGTAVITCFYRYNAMFRTVNSLTGYMHYEKIADSNKADFKGSDLDFGEIPTGYRISKIEVDGTGATLEKEDKQNYRNTVVRILGNLNDKRIITVTATLTDEWAVTVEYLVKYKDTPFAEKKTFEGKIKVLDFEDPELPGVLKKMTAEDLAKVLGIETMNVLKSTVDTIDQQFDEATETYSFVPKYTFSSLKQLDYNGTTSEVKVPLTSYKAWASDYGKDWSILFLNSSDKQWFTYSNEVAIENLYGYFAVAVFKEQVSDFNHWFKGSTGDGCMVLSEEMKVEGSKFYKISQKVQENSLFVAAAGAVVGGCIGGVQGAVIGGAAGLALPSVVMSACEIADDNNAMYYSYWFYLDGSSDLPFMAKNNAKTAEDTDGAAKNKFDAAMANAGEWVKEKWTEFKGSQTYEIVKWVLIVGACLVLVVLFIKLIIAIAKK